MKHYRIVPNDVIRSGSFSYELDTKAGTLSYQLQVVVNKWWVPNINRAGTEKINPDDFLSEKFKQIGKVLKFGPLTVMIKSVEGHVAKSDIRADLGDMKGHATYDLADKHIVLLGIQNATGAVMGINFVLNVVPWEE